MYPKIFEHKQINNHWYGDDCLGNLIFLLFISDL